MIDLDDGFDEICVALDLEMTGLKPEEDQIIEVGAIKFKGSKVIDTFNQLIDPGKDIPTFISLLTGITNEDVKGKPKFDEVANEFVEFLGEYSIVGQNIGFDMKFLAKVNVYPKSFVYDTRDLSRLLRPQAIDHGLAGLARELQLVNDNPHRALSDAETTMKVFNELYSMLRGVGKDTLTILRGLVSKQDPSWALGRLIMAGSENIAEHSFNIINKLDQVIDRIQERNRKNEERQRGRKIESIQAVDLESFFSIGGLADINTDDYQERISQKSMAVSIKNSFDNGTDLYVEAPPGTGKTMAYVAPSIIHSILDSSQVTIATSTKYLQEQILETEIPRMFKMLDITPNEYSVMLLKGQANYLCGTKYRMMIEREDLTKDEALFLLRTIVWLQITDSGDGGELYLNNREKYIWSQISANSSDHMDICALQREDKCFVALARIGARSSDLVITNHSLLLTDSIRDMGILTNTTCLIIDEAHNLEAEATSQYSQSVNQNEIQNWISQLTSGGRVSRLIGNEIVLLTKDNSPNMANEVQKYLDEIENQAKSMQIYFDNLFASLTRLESSIRKNFGGNESRVRISNEVKAGDSWNDVTVELDIFQHHISDLRQKLIDFNMIIADQAISSIHTMVSQQIVKIDDLIERLDTILSLDGDNSVTWISRSSDPALGLGLYYAPLDVAELLKTDLFNNKDSVILSSATMATNSDFSYIKGRLGLEKADELLLASPFDLDAAVDIYVPSDMPSPEQSSYDREVSSVITEISKTSQGGILVLFTSHGAIRKAYNQVKSELQGSDRNIMAQGIDGPPERLAMLMKENPNSVILGAAAFWEGVDLPGDALKTLIVTRLPFAVPTDPVIASRSETYESPFMDFTIPNSILRFRQGIGRLIRRSTDSGTIIILDSRILTRKYGPLYIETLPSTNVRTPSLDILKSEIYS
jgi:DNA polymerase-3 subunit epsilon/ATP-dependent DNA helicase DinG